jgi:outer membrane biosynthesis protein TonB
MAIPGNYTTAIPKKADVILRTEQEISAKQNQLLNECAQLMSQMQDLSEGVAQNKRECSYLYRQNSEIYLQLKEENEALKKELLYLAKQSENIFVNLSKKLEELSDEVKKIAIRQEEGFGEPAEDNVQRTIEEFVPAHETVVHSDVDYDRIGYIVADKLAEHQTDIDYEKIASLVSMREYISPDYIASKVAEQVVIPQPSDVNVAVDEEKIASLVAEKIVIPQPVVTYAQPEEKVEEPVEEKAEEKEEVAKEEIVQPQYVATESVHLDLDEEDLADRIALKVGTLKAEDFEILIDDAGCESLAKELAQKLDYDLISTTVAEKLRPTLEAAQADAEEFDYDEIAHRISEKIDVNAINEDAIADKAAAVLSNYLPDNDELVDKITSNVSDLIAAQPAPDTDALVEKIKEVVEEAKPEAVVDTDTICNTICERLIESQADRDYNIVIDDDGVTRISQLVSEEVAKENEASHQALEDKLNERLDDIVSRIDENATEQSQLIEDTSAAQIKAIEDNIATHTKVLDESNNVDYNIVIDDEGLNQISSVVSKDVELATAERFGKLEDDIAELRELVSGSNAVVVAPVEETEEEEKTEDETKDEQSEVKEEEVEPQQYVARTATLDSESAEKISQLVEENVEKLAERLDQIEANIYDIKHIISDNAVDANALYAEKLADHDHDIVIDDDGVERISKVVSDDVRSQTAELFEKLENDINDIKQSLAEGGNTYAYDDHDHDVVITDDGVEKISALVSDDVNRSTGERFDKLEEDIREIKETLAENAQDEEKAEETQGVVIADEGVDKISESVSEDVVRETADRFDSLEKSIEELKRMLAAGVIVSTAANNETAASEAAYDEDADEELVTVSDVVAEEPTEVVEETTEEAEEPAEVVAEPEEVTEEQTEEVTEEEPEEETEEVTEAEEQPEEVEEPAEVIAEPEEVTEEVTEEAEEQPAEETQASEEVEEPVEEPEEDSEQIVTVSDIVPDDETADDSESYDDTFADLDEQLVQGEMMPDGIVGISDDQGVDFANMMKYDRSFIARIIQGSDEQKGYYGAVKQALLSYKKVNSNVAWGSERFNKGRETIARFKIRGKTLCLYLALDPNEHKVSVYHHVDVTENKSMHGTPMMVKIKSPLGVKKAIRLIDEMLAVRDGIKRPVPERDYAAMYPYESIDELIEDGLVKDVRKNK